MQTNEKKTKKPAQTAKPFLLGKPFDSTCVRSVFGMLVSTLGMMLGFLILGGMMMWDNTILRIGSNALLLACGYMLFYYSGVNRGTVAVNQGEIMYQRKETGREINQTELERCFHPAKGFLIGLMGCIPLVICGILLACVAQRQMVTAGALPSWISGNTRPEIAAPLAAYHQKMSLGLEDVMRIIVRMSIMPVVNMVGTSNIDGLLTLERLSALLMLVPGLAYGIGYLRGVSVRATVHSNIAEGKRKQAKKARKARKKRQTRSGDKNPGQLN